MPQAFNLDSLKASGCLDTVMVHRLLVQKARNVLDSRVHSSNALEGLLQVKVELLGKLGGQAALPVDCVDETLDTLV